MKILLFYTYNTGYLSKFFFELSSRLSGDGHEVINYSLKPNTKTFKSEGVSVIIEKKGGYISNFYNIYKIIKKEKPDVILSNFSYDNPALLFGTFFKVKKRIIWAHSLKGQMMPKRINILIKIKFLKLSNFVFANSYLTKKDMNEVFKVPSKKIKVFPFWTNILDKKIQLDVSKIAAKKDTIYIGCPGRLRTHKNQRILIEAAVRLKNDYPTKNFKIFFAGKGRKRDELTEMVNALNLNDEITFVSHLSTEAMVHFYKEMDVIVLPSLHEAFGLVFIEAISLGTPVIVSKSFGALSFIDHEKIDVDCFTFDPNSVEELINLLTPYLNNSSVSSDFFKSIYKETFDKDRIYKLIEKELTN